ncbi:MAG: hypothetical protein N2747_11090 [Chitinophagaceae bacterium]|nr:hypothetical protein [Chitinophagaceae bacterium]
MAETLGSLCDKLTIVKLKQYHTEDKMKLQNLEHQEKQLIDEINAYIHNAITGMIPVEKLTFAANKVYKEKGNETRIFEGTIGKVFAELALVNCELWHEQEKVYDFESIPNEEKNQVVKRLAVLNLERNQCIEKIDSEFKNLIISKITS